MRQERKQFEMIEEQLLSEELAEGRLAINRVSYFIWPFLKEKRYLLAGYVCRKC